MGRKSSDQSLLKEGKKTTAEIYLESHDYYTEHHTIQTEDGYILTLQRVFKKSGEKGQEIDIFSTEGIQKDTDPKRPVALCVHGLMCSAEHWLINSPDKVLPYQLLDKGYDCWLANFRGTPLSRSHSKLRRNSKSYWNYSFHELAMFDIPAMIEYILKTTGSNQLSYIGHSMGCTAIIILLMMKPEYNEKIKVLVALAPAFYGEHNRLPIFKVLIPLASHMGKVKLFRNRPISTDTFYDTAKKISFKSHHDKCAAWLLKTLGYYTGGFGKTQIEEDRLIALSSSWPASSSVKTFCHGVQCWYTKKYRHFNYGRATNMKIYGSPKPPEYNLQNVRVPVATFHSDHDELCRPEDVIKLSKELPNLIGDYGIHSKGFAHMDFTLGAQNINELVYKDVFEILSRYNN